LAPSQLFETFAHWDEMQTSNSKLNIEMADLWFRAARHNLLPTLRRSPKEYHHLVTRKSQVEVRIFRISLTQLSLPSRPPTDGAALTCEPCSPTIKALNQAPSIEIIVKASFSGFPFSLRLSPEPWWGIGDECFVLL
jgi:hypothetical protein